jgi:hypothetical protein
MPRFWNDNSLEISKLHHSAMAVELEAKAGDTLNFLLPLQET